MREKLDKEVDSEMDRGRPGDTEVTRRWTLDSEEKQQLLVSLLGRVVDTVGQLGRGSDHAANSAALSCPTKLPAEEKREWKVFGIRKIHFFWGQNKKREGWLGSCGTKLESLELIGGNSRPPPSWITWITRYHTSWTSNAHKWIYSSWKKLVTKSNVPDFVRKHSAKSLNYVLYIDVIWTSDPKNLIHKGGRNICKSKQCTYRCFAAGLLQGVELSRDFGTKTRWWPLKRNKDKH